MVKVSQKTRRGQRGPLRRHSVPQSVPLSCAQFRATGRTRALSGYAGALHTQVCGCARARARVSNCMQLFLGLVKHNGTKWGKRVVGGVYKTYNPETQLLKPHGRPVNRLLTCLPTPAIFCFFPFSLSACLPGVQAAWRSVKATSLGAHIGPSPNDGSRSAVRAGSTTPRSIEGRCPPAPLATSGCSRATSKCHPPRMARHLPVQ